MNRECKWCGKSYIYGRDIAGTGFKFCSKKCCLSYSQDIGVKNQKHKPSYQKHLKLEKESRLLKEKDCAHCGLKYCNKDRGKVSKYCSDGCQKDSAYSEYMKRQRKKGVKPDVVARAERKAQSQKKLEKVCKTCGVLFYRNIGGKGRRGESKEGQYCSRDCLWADPEKKKKIEIKKLINIIKKKIRLETELNKKCKWCGVSFYAKSVFTVVCSEECDRQRNLLKIREKYEQEWEPTQKKCNCCGKIFTTVYKGSTWHCSIKCQKAMKKINKARRAERLRAVYVDDVNIYDLRIRDKGICGICHKKVDARRKAPHPLSPSIDHILPLAQGGWHEWSNVQLAHFSCNSRKGASIPKYRQLSFMEYMRNVELYQEHTGAG